MRKVLLVALVLGAGVGACGGGDDKPKAMPGTVNANQAKNTVTSAVGLRSSVDSMNGAQVATATLAFNASTGGIVSPSTGKALTLAVETMQQAQTSGSQMCTATGCVFTNYQTGGTTLNGELKVSGSDAKTINWDLTMKTAGVATGFGVDYRGKGNLTISTTSLTGDVTTTTSVQSPAAGAGAGVSGGQESYVRFDAVVLANGVATGGSLYARSTTTGSSGGQTASQSYEGTHSFAAK